MAYTTLKFMHVLSATLLLGSMGFCTYVWYLIRSPEDLRLGTQRIQRFSLCLVLPSLLVQLGSGFTLISLRQDIITRACMMIAASGFMLVTASWFGLIYLLLQQVQLLSVKRSRAVLALHKRYRQGQLALLSTCAITLLIMIFFMSNQLT